MGNPLCMLKLSDILDTNKYSISFFHLQRNEFVVCMYLYLLLIKGHILRFKITFGFRIFFLRALNRPCMKHERLETVGRNEKDISL